MLHLEPIPAFEDNYIWVVHDGRHALIVDPGEAEPILAWLGERRIRPAAILVTHHHGDHTGGISETVAQYPGTRVFGPAQGRIAGITHPVAEADVCEIPELGLVFQVIATPGHTLDHLVYVGHGWLFCGDTLFSCGCGKAFEGTPRQLHASLCRLAALPADTLACCAHEYTLDNLRFALTVDPDNPALTAWQRQAQVLRQSGQPTLPTRMGDECDRNPFLRCQDPALLRRLAEQTGTRAFADASAAFAALRELKNAFDRQPSP
jgi:hydroxyacylglutathione hydrolase